MMNASKGLGSGAWRHLLVPLIASFVAHPHLDVEGDVGRSTAAIHMLDQRPRSNRRMAEESKRGKEAGWRMEDGGWRREEVERGGWIRADYTLSMRIGSLPQ